MASTTWPSGTPKSVDDNQYEILGAAWSGDGVIGVPGDTSAVFGDSSVGRVVKFRAGKYAVVHGRGWSSGSSDISKTLTANSSGQPRIDLAVLGLDRSTWAVTEYVKTGTPSSSPSAPALQRDAMGAGTGKWEIPLATIAVASGATVITSGDVTPVAAFIGPAQTLYVVDVATLQQIPAPVAGQLVWVAGTVNQLYVYSASSGWRRADWNAPWGVIAGKSYTSNGADLAVGHIAEALSNMDTGSVVVTAGRRYAIDVRVKVTANADGAHAQLRVREGSVTGQERGYLIVPRMLSATGHLITWSAAYSETVTSTKTFVHTQAAYITTAGINTHRGSVAGEEVFMQVRDDGPAANLTTV